MPAVSVILSAYNAEKHISASIESVLNQTFRDFELIIIDDASTDRTLEIIALYGLKDQRIQIFKNSYNLFVIESRNIGIRAASAQYLAIIDADDIWYPQKLEHQLADLNRHPEIFLLSANAHEINVDGQIIGQVIRPDAPEESARILPHANPFCHPSILFRNEGYMYRPKMFYTEEYDLYLRMFSDGKKLVHRKDFLFQYRILPGSLSRGSKVLIQALFKHKAIELYHQRRQDGKDRYDYFDPQQFLHILEPSFRNTKKDLNTALKLAFVADLREDYSVLLQKATEQHGFASFAKYWALSKAFNFGQFLYKKI